MFKMASIPRTGGGDSRSLKKQISKDIGLMHPHDLAKDLHSISGTYLLLDCRPILAYNSCHITGAVNINFTGMTKRRFMAGKIVLTDLVTTEDGKEKFKSRCDWPTVVYDECSTDLQNLTSSNALRLVLVALSEMGMILYVLEGGLNEFNVLHPSLCEISLPSVRKSLTPAALRATTPGVRDQPLDWQTAPPVHVLSYLVLGGKKDAMSKEVFDDFKIRYVLNVTPTCLNCFENKGIEYLRIAVTDTGTQKLSDRFQEAFAFIEKARISNSIVLIHCMAGVSRSVTLTIAYLMYHFGLPMQSAYQMVKDRRPAISPNLNFMGQLVAFEREVISNDEQTINCIDDYLPTDNQERITESFMPNVPRSDSSNESTPSPKPNQSPTSPLTGGVGVPFVMKLPVGRNRKGKKQVSSGFTNDTEVKNSPTPRDDPGGSISDSMPNATI